MGIFQSTPMQHATEMKELKPLPLVGNRVVPKCPSSSSLPPLPPIPPLPQPPTDDPNRPLQELVTEFDRIHQHSTQILRSLGRNPCEDMKLGLTRCLQDNAKGMEKCFSVMDDYRACVGQQMSKKLGIKVFDNKHI